MYGPSFSWLDVLTRLFVGSVSNGLLLETMHALVFIVGECYISGFVVKGWEWNFDLKVHGYKLDFSAALRCRLVAGFCWEFSLLGRDLYGSSSWGTHWAALVWALHSHFMLGFNVGLIVSLWRCRMGRYLLGLIIWWLSGPMLCGL